MEYTVEEISPVRKKVTITVDPKEVEASIMATVALYRTSVQIDGFRKGKVPPSVVEKRFQEKIYQEAQQDLVNVHINEVMQELKESPLSGIDFDGEPAIARGVQYVYSITYDVLPAVDLPPYEGLDVEQEKALVLENEISEVIDRIRRDKAELVVADGAGPAKDGQIANLDFTAYDENGEPLEGIEASGFDMALGEGQALEDFEALVKTVPCGEEREEKVSFPADFLAQDLAGRTVTMKVKVHAIKERKLPELTDDLAKSMGFESVDKMREAITESYRSSREKLNKGAAQKELLDRLLKMVDFVIPDSMMDVQVRTLLADMRTRLERQGKSLESLGKKEEELREEVRPEAEAIARAQVFLMCVAKKEGLEVSDHEVNTSLFQMCQRSGEDFKSVRDAYERSGMMFTLRDRMLADKAMDLIYAKAKVTEVEPKEKTSDEKDEKATSATA